MLKRWLTTAAVLLFVGVVVELVVLGLIVWQVGAAWTIGLLIVKCAVGYLLARRTGRRGWRQFRAALDSGQPPGREWTESAVGFGGAMLVLLAGFVGAVLGLVLLLPPVRRAATGLAEKIVEKQVTAVAANQMFGPRRVTVQRGTAERSTERPAERSDGDVPDGDVPDGDKPSAGNPPAVLEGEILPPR